MMPKPLGPITHLTIHATATPEGRDIPAATISQWDVRRFGQVSYHWTLELSGNAVATLADNLRGAHTGGHNSGNVGVSYIGGMTADNKHYKDTRTAGQLDSLEQICRRYRQRYPGIIILGHRDWSPDLNHDGKISPNEWLKACPCFEVSTWLKAIGL